MNRRNFLLLIVLGLLIPLLATQAAAQSNQLFVEVPFSFTACHDQLPAGKYYVRPVSSTNSNLLLVRSEDNRSVDIVCTRDIQGAKAVANGKLVFSRYGDEYFLAEMWFPGQRTGVELPQSEREASLLRELGLRKRGKVTVKIIEVKQ
jgi:hypothetical protein